MGLKNKFVISSLLLSFTFSIISCNNSVKLNPINDPQNVSQGQNDVFANAKSGEIVVKKKIGSKSIASKELGFTTIKTVNKLGIEVIKTNTSMQKALTVIRNMSDVIYAEPNYKRKLIVPRTKVSSTRSSGGSRLNRAKPRNISFNDPIISSQYALDKISAGKAWGITHGRNSVTIAIVDTGVDLKHPDLKGKIVEGFNAIKRTKRPVDENGHGTHCAGIAAASTDNSTGIAGLAPRNMIMPIKVLDKWGGGDDAGIAEGIAWAVDHGASVISMSLGGPGSSQTLEDAVAYALKKNVTVVSAMGNDGENIEHFPAAYDGVIAVGSTDSKDKRSSFSNFGDWISVSAPGTAIMSTFPTYSVFMSQDGFSKNYTPMDGTSMATPYVSGLAALILSKYGKKSPREIKNWIESTSDDLGQKGYDKFYGHGRINAFKALSKRR